MKSDANIWNNIRQQLYEKTGFTQREILILLASIIIGVTVLGANYLNYQGQQNQYTITYQENITDDQLTISRSAPATVTFQIANPENREGVGIHITFKDIGENTEITPNVNGKTFESQDGLVAGSTHTLHVEQTDLKQENNLRIDGKFSVTNAATIQKISVTGVTTTQRWTFLGLNIFGIIVIIGPILIIKYRQYSERKVLEQQFPNFLRDVVEGTRAGMALPHAIKNTQTNNYSDLSPYVNQMSAKLDWGIPFERALDDFSRQTHSQVIQRSVSTIIQTYRAGGNVSEVLETIGSNLKEIRELRKERESQVYGEMVTGYIVFFVFLLVLVILVKYLLPSLTFSGAGSIGAIETESLSAGEITETYRTIFQWMIIVQSVFSGLVIGRLSEGNFKAGGKHIAILFGIGYTVAVVLM